MPRPDLPPNLAQMLAKLQLQVDQIARREAFLNKRTVIGQAGGLSAIPVPILTPDASGNYTLTGSYAGAALFVAGGYAALWVLLATNGNSGDFTAQLTYPNDSNRLLATSTFVEVHPNLGPVHRVAFTQDAVLDAAVGAYATTINLQAKSTNTGVTNKYRVIASGWGTANV